MRNERFFSLSFLSSPKERQGMEGSNLPSQHPTLPVIVGQLLSKIEARHYQRRRRRRKLGRIL